MTLNTINNVAVWLFDTDPTDLTEGKIGLVKIHLSRVYDSFISTESRWIDVESLMLIITLFKFITMLCGTDNIP